MDDSLINVSHSDQIKIMNVKGKNVLDVGEEPILISKDPWYSESVDMFPYGAVTDQLLTSRVLQNNCIVQVTQVNCNCIWLFPKPWQPR